MHSAAQAPPSSQVYEIQFHRFSRAQKNFDFKGKGTLEISEEGDRFTFRGKQASLIAPRQELVFDAANLANVSQSDDMITFQTSKGESGAKKKPFLFYCESPEIAAEIIAKLPARKTEAHLEDMRRIDLLDASCPPIPALSSPTFVIAAINLIVFVIMASWGGAGWFEPNIDPYIKYGANNGAFTANGEWWRLFSSMFLHYGLVHIALNTWVMKDVGRLLERILGRTQFVVVYIGAGITASLASVIWYKDTVWSAGASGAVFGIYGALLALSLMDKKNLPTSLFAPVRKSSIAFLGYNLLFGLTYEGIDNAAHIGGLLSGFLLGAIAVCPLDASDRQARLARKLRNLFGASACLITVGVIACPTFDYNPYEELEFGDRWFVFSEEDEKHYNQAERILNEAEDGPEQRERAMDKLRNELIPFYEEWSLTFSSSVYRPDSPTERNRSLLAEFADLKAQSYQAFLDYLTSPSDEASERYWKLVEQADSKIEAINQE